jgi:ketosteroid isomerase-like protein
MEHAFNAGDLDALADLYDPDACLLAEDGSAATGADAIRQVYGPLIGLGGRISLTTRHAVEVGDLALLSNSWTFEIGGVPVASAVTAEVAKRQPDGSWRYLIDNPYAAPATAPSAMSPE